MLLLPVDLLLFLTDERIYIYKFLHSSLQLSRKFMLFKNNIYIFKRIFIIESLMQKLVKLS